MHQLIYKLDKLNEIPLSNGQLRQATDSDLDLMIDWVGRFQSEVFQLMSTKEATKLAVKKIQEGAFYLWETDRPVSMAGWTRPTQNGVTIAFVYTPVKFRKMGYATSCVAKLSACISLAV